MTDKPKDSYLRQEQEAGRIGSHLPYHPATDRAETGGDEIEFAVEAAYADVFAAASAIACGSEAAAEVNQPGDYTAGEIPDTA